MSIPNQNPETGFFYGIIKASNLHPETVDDLMNTGVNHSYLAALEEEALQAGFEKTGSLWTKEEAGVLSVYLTAQDALVAAGVNTDEIEVEEPCVTSEREDTKVQTMWIGGCLHFAILESPWVCHNVPACSPCVPYAGDLDSWLDGREGGVSAYIPPRSWLDEGVGDLNEWLQGIETL